MKKHVVRDGVGKNVTMKPKEVAEFNTSRPKQKPEPKFSARDPLARALVKAGVLTAAQVDAET